MLYAKLDRKAAWKASQNGLSHLHERLRLANGGDIASFSIADLLQQERQQRDQETLGF
ncbi:hypothetical protein PGN35_010075 [Nodosilinea sp. PGN35]